MCPLKMKSRSRPRLDGVLTRTRLLQRIDALSATRRLVGPVARHEPACDPPVRYFYQPVRSAAELALDFTYCVYGAKGALLPPRETLLEFNRADGRFHASPAFDDRATALLGVHPCDLHAIRLLDEVFARDSRDEHYLTRRRNTLLVGIDCPRPCAPQAYCGDMHANSAADGFDVMLYPLAGDSDGARAVDEFGAVFGTQAGRAWLSAEIGAGLRSPNAEHARRFEQYLERKRAAFPLRFSTPREQFPTVLAASYDSPVWEEAAQRCYSCGSCNQVCPTCYCFDIRDELDLPQGGGVRERVWDSCMLPDFALVAGGHNFRPTAAERLRHRVHRKLSWIERRTGRSGCVGCARCERACTARISMVDILNRLAERSSAEPGAMEQRAAEPARDDGVVPPRNDRGPGSA